MKMRITTVSPKLLSNAPTKGKATIGNDASSIASFNVVFPSHKKETLDFGMEHQGLNQENGLEMGDDLTLQFSDMGIKDSSAGGMLDDYGSDMHHLSNSPSVAGCNLIVNYLPHDVDDLSLKGLFQDYGDIIMTKVVRDKNTKKSLGYGFVKFMQEADALQAIDKMNGFSIGHKVLKVSIARPPSLEIRNCKLYVTNLPKEYGEREVTNLFQEFGEIIECRVLRDRNSKFSKGVAFVQFNLKSQATAALALNGCQVEGSSRGLIVKFAEDQHKKKELSRLHNLTLTAAFRGVSTSMPSPLNMGGMNMNMGQPRGMPPLDDNLGNYYYQNHHQPPPGGGMFGRSPQGQQSHQHMPQNNLGPLYIQPPSATSPYGPRGAGNSHHPHHHHKGGLGEPFGQQMPTSPSNWYPPVNVTSPHLSYMQSPNNMMHLGGHPTNSLDFDFSSIGQANNVMPMMGAMGLPPPPTSPHMSHHHGMAQFGGLIGSPVGLGGSFSGAPVGGMGPPPPQQQPPGQGPMPQSNQQQQPPQGGGGNIKPGIQLPHQNGSGQGEGPVTMVLNYVPNTVNARVVHSLVAPYGQVLDLQLEEITPTGSGSSPNGGLLRVRITWANRAQAEEAARNLEGMVVFEGIPPLQVTYF